MDNNGGEPVGDQGTGWFQVKKKHRSSSKFSLQSWVGGISGRNGSNSRDKYSQGNETNQDVQCPNNGVSKRPFENPKSNPPRVLGDSSVRAKSLPLEEVSHVENFGSVGIKFGAIGDDDIDNDLGIDRIAQLEDDNNQRDLNEESVNKEVTHIEEVKEVNGESLTANSSFGDSSKPNLIEKNPETVLVGGEPKIFEKRPISSSDIASSSQSTNVLGESDSVESKERFRQR